MKRTIVRVVKIRIRDVVPGDVVNKDPNETKGWFEVVELRRLHDGSVTVASRVAQLSFSGYPDDIVGLQLLEATEVPPRPGSPAVDARPAPGDARAPQGAAGAPTAQQPSPAARPPADRAWAPTPGPGPQQSPAARPPADRASTPTPGPGPQQSPAAPPPAHSAPAPG